ncbi:MAG: S26 family signal peptidase, partial [Planctomycetota bacterium]
LRTKSYNEEQADTIYSAQIRLPRVIRAELRRKQPDELTAAEAAASYGTGPDNPATAPKDAYLMLGDNSPLSFDGREWGWVPAENLRGKAWLVVFPPQRWKVIR